MKADRTPYTTTHYIWNRVSAMFYSAYVTPFHSHNTMQLVFDLGKQFRFRTNNTGWAAYKCLVIKENVVHRLDTGGSVQLIIYLDPHSDIAVNIRSQYLGQKDFFGLPETLLHAIKPGELEQCLIGPDRDLLESVVQRLLDKLQTGKIDAPDDQRVRQVKSLIAREQDGEISISRLSANLFISESRLRSVFRDAAGMSLHRYILLRKIFLAITSIMNGTTIAAAAIGAGFADSSHFHKTLLQMFGTSPSQFIRDNSTKKIERLPGSPFRLVTRQYDERSWAILREIER